MRKLGLDFGTKICGFAITDELSILANALENFERKNDDLQEIVNRIEYWQNFYENKIDTIVIGLPTNVNGSDNPRTILVREFVDYLKNNWKNPIKIVMSDECFTTQIATQYLKDMNLKASKIKKIKDKISAVIILEDYLRTINF